MLKFGYKKVGPNEALIITGPGIGKDGDPGVYASKGRMMKVARGSVFVTPFQNAETVSLNSMQIKLTTPRIVTSEGVPLRVWATATIKIADSLDSIVHYAEQFLGKDKEDVKSELINILSGNLRTIVAKLTALEVNNAREEFVFQVRKIAQDELDRMGFTIVSLVLDDVKDDDEQDGFLINLGAQKIAESKRDAEIARSNAEREIAIKKAQNEQETKQEADQSQIKIAESEKKRKLNETTIQEETSKAQARSEQAYALEQARLQQELVAEQTKVKKQEEEAKLQIQQLEKQAKLVEAEIKAQDEKIRADTAAEISERKAQAETNAQKYQAQIENEVLERKGQAEANALKYQTEVENAALERKGQAEAEIIRQRGLAEAEVIRQRGLSEAEAKERMAEAMAKFGQAAITEMIIKVLPDVAKAIAEPLSNISEVKVFDMGGNGEGNGLQNFAGTSLGMLGVVKDILRETTGIDMKEIVESNASFGRNQLTNTVIPDEPTLPTDETEQAVTESEAPIIEEEE